MIGKKGLTAARATFEIFLLTAGLFAGMTFLYLIFFDFSHFPPDFSFNATFAKERVTSAFRLAPDALHIVASFLAFMIITVRFAWLILRVRNVQIKPKSHGE